MRTLRRSPRAPSPITSAMIRAAALAGAIVAVSLLGSRDSEADCNHNCPGKELDAHGCCPPAPQAVKPGGAAGMTCTDGKETNADTEGHCCWRGQVWAGGKCVGAPTACPKGHVLERAREACVLSECPAGMGRAPNEKTECCWPGQAWSKVRATCVGKPRSCPKTHELQGETCLSLDLDGDGIPNKLDKCPNEPEDKNGFEDDDGCPDEPKLRAQREAVERAAREKREALARAERAEREAVERAAREKREAEERQRAQAAAEEQKRREEHAARLEAARKKAAEGRGNGAGFITVGSISLAVMGICVGAGAAQNGRIHDGGFATAADIEKSAKLGKTLNIVAIVTGAAGGALAATGIILMAVNREPKDSDVARAAPAPRAALTLGPAGIGLSGSF